MTASHVTCHLQKEECHSLHSRLVDPSANLHESNRDSVWGGRIPMARLSPKKITAWASFAVYSVFTQLLASLYYLLWFWFALDIFNRESLKLVAIHPIFHMRWLQHWRQIPGVFFTILIPTKYLEPWIHWSSFYYPQVAWNLAWRIGVPTTGAISQIEIAKR